MNAAESSGDFAAFFQAVHGFAPFPWQTRLARVVATAGWPSVIALPTASGKTSLLDIAVFQLAGQAERPPTERTAPLRIFFVIDRRLVVDEASDHARRLAAALADPATDHVAWVARRLLLLGGEQPLQVVTLRGGLYRDDRWIEAPQQPTVAVSTVDQIGSRLLFRGYGLSEFQQPLHAGLIGNDALFIVDEAHLSQPFVATLAAARKYRGWAERPLGGPLALVVMSATPPDAEPPFRLAAADRAHPVLGARLAAAKPALLLEINSGEFETAMVEQAQRLAGEEGVTVVGIIVNRVAVARALFERLRRVGDALLLTGRCRPHERDRLLERWWPRIRAGRHDPAGSSPATSRPRPTGKAPQGAKARATSLDLFPETLSAATGEERIEPSRPLFVVATQTIEVGANLDFDALVTEAAPLAALRQRFGRLDRLGRRGRSPAVILYRKPEKRGPDPVYGEDLEKAWKWLNAQATRSRQQRSVDFGVDALETLLAAGDAPVPAAPLVPTLLPAHLEQWVQTSPRPWPDPDVAPFLHGTEPAEADVQIVWRADLDPTDARLWPEIVALGPPLQTEALAVPLWAARAWLTAAVVPSVSDLEGIRGATIPAGSQERRPLRWRGPEAPETRIVAPAELRLGDTLVVPAAWGGADEFGWFPDSRQPVVDLADRCAVVRAASAPGARKPYRLRLHPLLLADWLADAPETTGRLARDNLAAVLRALTVPEMEESPRPPLAALLDVLAEFADPVLTPALAAFRARPPRLIPYPGDQPAGVVLAAAGPLGFTDDDDSSSLTRPVPLTVHGDGVAAWARRFGRQCRLPEAVAEDVELAARLHDLGKADARFQLLLHGGDELAAAGAVEPLAKSGLDPTRTALLKRARARSGLPHGFRHELVSVALVESEGTLLASARDPDLVKYLIGVHHGRARPFPPVVADETPEMVRVESGGRVFEASSAHGLERLDSGWVELFWRLNRRYGFWGLAYLEALLRLADWRRSREEQEQEQ